MTPAMPWVRAYTWNVKSEGQSGGSCRVATRHGQPLALLLDILSLALLFSFGDRLAEHGHELADAAPSEARVAGELALRTQLHRWLLGIL